jgi:hypothetical protein
VQRAVGSRFRFLVPLRSPLFSVAGPQVLYGMDYVSAERGQQHAFLREALLDHLRRCDRALIVVEEYDKLDCATRALFRQLIQSSQTANVSLNRCAPDGQTNRPALGGGGEWRGACCRLGS